MLQACEAAASLHVCTTCIVCMHECLLLGCFNTAEIRLMPLPVKCCHAGTQAAKQLKISQNLQLKSSISFCSNQTLQRLVFVHMYCIQFCRMVGVLASSWSAFCQNLGQRLLTSGRPLQVLALCSVCTVCLCDLQSCAAALHPHFPMAHLPALTQAFQVSYAGVPASPASRAPHQSPAQPTGLGALSEALVLEVTWW